MNERQRQIFLFIDACQHNGKKATAWQLSQMSGYADMTIMKDLRTMRDLGMVQLRQELRELTGGYTQIAATLTPKGEGLLPRVKELA